MTPRAAMSLFCDTALAGRIERVETQLITLAGQAARARTAQPGFVIPLAGGVAAFAEDGSPVNKVAGLGFHGVPSAAELDEVERAFAVRGCPVQVELSNLAEPVIGALLTDRGYRLVGFEDVLGREIDGPPDPVAPPGVEVRLSTEDEFRAWHDVVATAFANPDVEGVPSHESFPDDIIERAERDMAAAGGVRYIALRDGVVAGGAGLRIADGVAQMTGAATAPAHRRRGIQTAMLVTRLADAAAAGCDIAVVTTQPGSKSQQNVQRRGFDLLYTRAVLVKDPG
jgi:ribosomal protein S18 acetylase RimI-like enzyme